MELRGGITNEPVNMRTRSLNDPVLRNLPLLNDVKCSKELREKVVDVCDLRICELVNAIKLFVKLHR